MRDKEVQYFMNTINYLNALQSIQYGKTTTESEVI